MIGWIVYLILSVCVALLALHSGDFKPAGVIAIFLLWPLIFTLAAMGWLIEEGMDMMERVFNELMK